MEHLLPSFKCILSHNEDFEDEEKSGHLLDGLVRLIDNSAGVKKESHIKLMLRLSQLFNRIALNLQYLKPFIDSNPSDTPLEVALSAMIRDCVCKSQYQINRAIDEILKRDRLFDDEKLVYPIESDELMLAVTERLLQEAPASSSVYIPRQPRLPGLPIPPPDQFGEWDEYRDDLDPGYRVREVFEEDYRKEFDSVSQSTTGTQNLISSNFDDELMQTSTPGGACVMDENDELSGAAPSMIPASQIPSVFADVVVSTQRSDRTSAGSPAFGEHCSSAPLLVPRVTLRYDYMGGQEEVPRPVHAKRLDFNASKALYQGAELREYPMEVRDGDRKYTLEELRLSVVYESGKTGFETSKEFDSSPGVLVAGKYRIESHLGQAAFSKAVKALDIVTNQSVCLKIIKNDKDFLDQCLDEIKILRLIKANGGDLNKNCLALIDSFYWREHLILVTELLLDNLYEFSKFNRSLGQTPYFTLGKLQRLTHQILIALEFVHEMGLIHCDLKPENILFKSYSRCEAKVIDFGSACFQTDKLSSYVQSRCYRAPEVILGCLPYDEKVDLWSLGCIIAELWTGFVLFQNDSAQSLLARVLGIIGPIPPWMLKQGKNVPQYFTSGLGELFIEIGSQGGQGPQKTTLQILVPKRTSLFQRMRIEDEEFLSFLTGLLQIDPALRMSASEALAHPWLSPGRYSDGLAFSKDSK